ncbi:hypothetical protein JRQ81_017203 [Phrynocephalus forsythii]|uniref:AB hydrolase-1 domain-containing protein n=1 Tax=Phrynocephalus forsythii TaxID=171643 RepID=A0A9Q0XQJ7_9SAUR|nr:hypothetical protein JRQ81_017203 [Phrynocephalus forsythii]
MAKYDLPACINFVLNVTGQQQLYYIAHSQGTTTGFIAFSKNLQLAAKIKLFIALAPVVTVKHAATPLATLSMLTEFQIKLLFGNKAFLPQTDFGAMVRSTLCSQEILIPICTNVLFIICGFNANNLNTSRLDVYTAHTPAATSVQNMIHWKQAFLSGKFRAFDYGWIGNKVHYDQYLQGSVGSEDWMFLLSLADLAVSSASTLQLRGADLVQYRASGRLMSKMLLYIMMSFLILGFSDSKQYSREKRELAPETFMNISIISSSTYRSEVIQYQGYPNEEYEVLTDDGYYLVINRIPCGRKNPENTASKPAVLVLPGLLTNAGSWVINKPNNSLGFVLADAGFDVWLANNRGSRWCRRHQNFSIDQEEFWDFSFHEMGMNDLPAIINFILAQTGQEKIFYIGHSQGSTIAFIAFSAMPELAEKIKLFFALAPVASLNHTRSPYPRLAFFADNLGKFIWGNKEFSALSNKVKHLNAKLCSYSIIDKLCLHIFFMFVGYNEKNLNASRADVYTGIYPDYSSVKTIIHWSQVAKSKEFKYFDYGSKNQAIYNMSTPPFYRIEEMAVPTALWSGGNDFVEDKKDIELLLPRITHLVFYKNIPSWQHLDFMWGMDAPENLYTDILNLMQKFK